MSAVTTNPVDLFEPRRAWKVVLLIALLHLLVVSLYRFGLPDFYKPRKSEITIELAGSMPRGGGGAGVPQVAAPRPPDPQKAKVQDDLATRQAKKPTQATAAPPTPSASSAAPGEAAAPTVDADYKAAYLNNPKPPYPPLAFRMKVEGTVMLKVHVQPDGSCGEVLLARTSGNDLLDRSAMDTVAKWKFTPAKSQGKDIAQWVSIPITFSIKRR